MAKYRKKPVVIDAIEWIKGRRIDPMHSPEFAGLWGSAYVNPDGSCTIVTLEGNHRCDIGDYIIRGVKGEFYPCKPDIFALTYEPADASEVQP